MPIGVCQISGFVVRALNSFTSAGSGPAAAREAVRRIDAPGSRRCVRRRWSVGRVGRWPRRPAPVTGALWPSTRKACRLSGRSRSRPQADAREHRGSSEQSLCRFRCRARWPPLQEVSVPTSGERPPRSGSPKQHRTVGQCDRMNASLSPSSILRGVFRHLGSLTYPASSLCSQRLQATPESTSSWNTRKSVGTGRAPN